MPMTVKAMPMHSSGCFVHCSCTHCAHCRGLGVMVVLRNAKSRVNSAGECLISQYFAFKAFSQFIAIPGYMKRIFSMKKFSAWQGNATDSIAGGV